AEAITTEVEGLTSSGSTKSWAGVVHSIQTHSIRQRRQGGCVGAAWTGAHQGGYSSHQAGPSGQAGASDVRLRLEQVQRFGDKPCAFSLLSSFFPSLRRSPATSRTYTGGCPMPERRLSGRCLTFTPRPRPKTCRLPSGFTVAGGEPATKQASRRSRRHSWA